MPDENKFQKLSEVGYQVPVTCGLCIHGPAKGWGRCGKHRYDHLRQNNPLGGRGVSVHAAGTCAEPELDRAKLAALALGAHRKFVR